MYKAELEDFEESTLSLEMLMEKCSVLELSNIQAQMENLSAQLEELAKRCATEMKNFENKGATHGK